MRWNLGLPEALKPHGRFRGLLFWLILIDTALTPFLLPVIGYAFYRDQTKVQLSVYCLKIRTSIYFLRTLLILYVVISVRDRLDAR